MSLIGGSFGNGVLTSCLGCFVATLGVQLRISALAVSSRKIATLRELTGWVLWAIGQGLGQVAIAIAPASVIACTTFCGSLLSNALLAPVILHEQLTWAHWVGLLFLALGGSSVTVASSHETVAYSVQDLSALAHREVFLAMMMICFLAGLPLVVNAWQLHSVGLWCFAYLFALCGATDLLLTKCTLQILQLCWPPSHTAAATASERPPLLTLTLFAACMLVTHIASLGFWVASTSYGDALQNTPIFLGIGTLLQVVMCGTFFNEFAHLSVRRELCFCGGFACMLLGLAITTYGSKLQRECAATKQQRQLVEELLAAHEDLPATSPLLTSGIMEKRIVDVARSADLLLLPELQRSAVCFRAQTKLPQLRQVGSEPPWPMFGAEPTIRTSLRQVSTAPGGVLLAQ
mmetsp:Transcript_49698/g.118422  ORF Transcript_49698/g.118422 Transcript_49698/m.118422 type:complete len:404 (-) Transcript_49698:43-1254(-)